jgi:hypothetical protein
VPLVSNLELIQTVADRVSELWDGLADLPLRWSRDEERTLMVDARRFGPHWSRIAGWGKTHPTEGFLIFTTVMGYWFTSCGHFQWEGEEFQRGAG